MNGVMNDDAHCLEQYIRDGSEPAFRKVVERYIGLVNSTARRMTGGNVHLAEDVTQLVFTDLARKASSLPRGTILGGWLHRHTCYTALKALRTENRRHQRETIAMEIQTINETSSHDAHWLELAPVLDEALNRLGTGDRDVILLRYFQQQDIRSIGQNLGTTETAIQKRLGRALEKLRSILTRRGVTLASVTVLGTTLEAGVVTPVSTDQSAAVSTKAVGSAAATTGFCLTYLLAIISAKRIVVGLAAILILAGLIIVLVKQNSLSFLPANVSSKTNVYADSLLQKQVKIAQVELPKTAPEVPKNDDSSTNVSADQQQSVNNAGDNFAPPPPPSPPMSRGIRGQMPKEWDVTYTYPNGTVDIQHRVRQEPPASPTTQSQDLSNLLVTSIVQNADGTRAMVLSNGSTIDMPKPRAKFIINPQEEQSIDDQGGPAVVAKRDNITIVINNHDGTSTATRADGSTVTYPTPGLP